MCWNPRSGTPDIIGQGAFSPHLPLRRAFRHERLYFLGNYSGAFCSLGQEGATVEGTAEVFEHRQVADSVATSEVVLSSCASWADFDNDGDQDLFVTSEGRENRLYRNNGDGSFTKITQGSVVEDVGHSFGCAWGDFDNDGFADLSVANFHGLDNFLYRNNGDGSFTRITEGPVVTDGGDSVGCAWGDVNNDGRLDLFVANESGQDNFLYLNEGNGRFQRVTVGVIVNDGGN